MKQIKTPALVGFLFLLVSITMYISGGTVLAESDQSGFVIVNFGLTGIYWTIYMVAGRSSDQKSLIQNILISLFFFSAHTFNRELVVFEQCSTWFLSLQFLGVAALLFDFFIDRMPNWLKWAQFITLSLALLCWLYMTVYVTPLYLIGLIGIVALGLGLHIFVPILLFIRTLFILKNRFNEKQYQVVLWSISSTVVLLCVLFVIQWNLLSQSIGRTVREARAYAKDGVPAWISVVKDYRDEWLFSDFVKMDIEYQVSKNSFSLWGEPRFNDQIVKLHNPLIMIASLFSTDPLLESDKIHILKAIYGYVGVQELRLWSGKDLYTEAVTTSIQLWPNNGIQYTEHTFQVTNGSEERWQGQNEAIYIFQLPSGGTVTSLSLWVNGKEEKGVLTTKSKAAEAYKNIVGVQRRDPSWVEWREGNKVAVRVFPVNNKESRVFKIGITAPMKKEAMRWSYLPSTWEGPVKKSTRYQTRVLFAQDPVNVHVAHASMVAKNQYEVDELPSSNITIEMDAPEKLQAEFGYDQHRYVLSNYLPSRMSFDPQDIYLDINASWTNQEISAMKTLFANKSIYVYQKEMVKWEPKNGDKVLNQLRQQAISCFPFFLIKDREHSLIVTKPSLSNIAIEDLEESDYAIKLKADRSNGQPVRCFLLNAQSSGYYKTLIDSRYLIPEIGNTDDLKELIVQKQFAVSEESDQKIVIPELGVQIQEDSLPVQHAATDHIYRLFQYNQILRSAATDSTAIVRAEKANVVSPVSSLIVLESAQDYKDQGIDTDQKGLGNAGIQSKGAAPEPEEWLLIILFCGTLVYWYFRKKKQITTA